jgi:hypothetical protein
VSVVPESEDIDGDPVSFEITTLPAHGQATVNGNAITYQPALEYIGSDTLRFRAFDGTAYSQEATLTISVISTNTAPVARDFTRKIQPTTASIVKFNASDPDGDSIIYKIITQPLHGKLYGTTGPNFLYVPATDYEGPERVTYLASDGVLESAVATAEIFVIRENRSPESENQSIKVGAGNASPLRLILIDEDADPLETIILKGPAKGLIYGAGTNLFYLPRAGALGADQFTYKAWDGQKFGNPRTAGNRSDLDHWRERAHSTDHSFAHALPAGKLK